MVLVTEKQKKLPLVISGFKLGRKVLAHPCVVEAVTLTTIIVALVRICCSVSLFLHFSRLFPNS